ncbi:MAG: MotA/TolQ/ExbB proton channel family protein [Verrucomicrobiota bacterium]
MWPLLVLSVVSAGIIAERLFFSWKHRYRVGESLDRLEEARNDPGLLEGTENPILRMGQIFLTAAPGGEEHCNNLSEREASRWINRHEWGLRVLSVIGSIAPLIGLLGTVWGMVKAFAEISALGEKVTPADFASGIWTGLLTTVAGLLVAIPAVTACRLFEARIDKLVHDFNEVGSHLKEWAFSREGNDGPG